MSFPSLRARLRMKAPLPNTALLRDELSLTLDGAPKTLSLTRLTNSEIIYESDIFTLERKALNIKALGKGLVAEYLFYEGSGTTLHDSSGNGINSTISSDVEWVQLSNGKWVVHCKGTDTGKYGDSDILSNNAFVTSTPFTIEVLFKLLNIKSPGSNVVIAYGKYGGTAKHAWIYINSWGSSDRRIIVDVGDGSANAYIGTPIGYAEIGKWYHVVAVVDPPEIMKLCINYSYIHSVKPNLSPFSMNAPLHISFEPQKKAEIYVAIVRLWNRKLIDDEIGTLFELAKLVVPELGG